MAPSVRIVARADDADRMSARLLVEAMSDPGNGKRAENEQRADFGAC